MAAHVMRADVENILKPILDALKGIVYFDDKQVRSVRVVAISPGEYVSIHCADPAVRRRLYRAEEFLIDIYNQIGILGPGNGKPLAE